MASAAAKPQAAGGGVGVLISNIIIMALVWAVGWGLGDITAYVISRGGDFGSDINLEVMFANAAAGGAAGALAAILVAIPYYGVSASGGFRILVTLAFWIGGDVVLYYFWDELGVYSLEDYLGFSGTIGLAFGLVLAITLQLRKPGWFLVRVPLAALLIAAATVAGRYAQIELLNF